MVTLHLGNPHIGFGVVGLQCSRNLPVWIRFHCAVTPEEVLRHLKPAMLPPSSALWTAETHKDRSPLIPVIVCMMSCKAHSLPARNGPFRYQPLTLNSVLNMPNSLSSWAKQRRTKTDTNANKVMCLVRKD